MLAASIGVYLCRGRRAERGTVLAAACIAANACAGARLAYYWNAFALVCSIPFFLTAAAAGRLHGAERRSFGAVSCLSILMLIKAAPFLVVAHILVGVWLVELWNSGYRVVNRNLELRLRVARRALGRTSKTGKRSGTGNCRRRGRRALARCATH